MSAEFLKSLAKNHAAGPAPDVATKGYVEATLAASDKEYPFVVRFVVTHVNKEGFRQMTSSCQGRNTYDTWTEANDHRKAILENNTEGMLASVHGEQSINSYRVRPTACYPRHHDPQCIQFGLSSRHRDIADQQLVKHWDEEAQQETEDILYRLMDLKRDRPLIEYDGEWCEVTDVGEWALWSEWDPTKEVVRLQDGNRHFGITMADWHKVTRLK